MHESDKLENMIKDILILKEEQLRAAGHISFSTEELAGLSSDDAKKIIDHFHGIALMELPEQDVLFFDWLKKADHEVWNDLWRDEELPYRISIDLLPHFLEHGNGFPICDLLDAPNFWFTAKHIKPKGKELFAGIEQKIKSGTKLTFVEALLAEISQGSIDIWHFCYRYKFPVAKAKAIAERMHVDDLLVHLPDREDLIKYLDI